LQGASQFHQTKGTRRDVLLEDMFLFSLQEARRIASSVAVGYMIEPLQK
jgi:hypothetical protein